MMLTYLLVAVGLAMDAFAVSVTSGIRVARMKPLEAVRIAFTFGAFQFAMPIAGWLAGESFHTYIEGFDHWVAFGLLLVIGIKMIVESFTAKDDVCPGEETDNKGQMLDTKTLLTLGIATSIDALAVGISYSMLRTSILEPAAIIGIVTFALCLFGCECGKRLGLRFGHWAEITGGVVLVGIGLKILLEHMM